MTANVSPSPVGSVSKPMAASRRRASSSATATPSSRATRDSRSVVVRGAYGRETTSAAAVSLPPATSASKPAARAAARIWPSGSTPRSKRYEASVERPRAFEARRTLGASNPADSMRTRVVASVTAVEAPPITPATATGASASAITSVPSGRSRATPSSVSMVSPARLRRTTTVSPRWSRSKACSGCPVSWSTTFVTSTTLLTERMPMAARRSTIHAGLGPTATFSTISAA